MPLHTLEQEQRLPITIRQAWDFFSSPGNLDEITPDDLGFQITSPLAAKMHEGQILTYRVKIIASRAMATEWSNFFIFG